MLVNKLMTGVVFAISAVLVAGISPTTAQAQTLTINQKFLGNTENQGTVVFDADFGGPGGIDYIPTYFGAESASLAGYGGAPDPLSFDAYCIDLNYAALHVPYQVDIHSTNSFPLGRPDVDQGGALAWLYNSYAPSVLSDNRQSAALQLAIWEAEYDWDGVSFVGGTNSSINLKNGFFQFGGTVAGVAVDTDILNRANTMLTTWGGQKSEAVWFSERNPPPDDKAQALIGPRLSQGVPEPGTMALALLGVLPFLGRVRAFRRR